jgi:hypothetical protein
MELINAMRFSVGLILWKEKALINLKARKEIKGRIWLPAAV